MLKILSQLLFGERNLVTATVYLYVVIFVPMCILNPSSSSTTTTFSPRISANALVLLTGALPPQDPISAFDSDIWASEYA